MIVQNTDNGKKGSFTAVDGDVIAGKMTYVWAGPAKMIIDHTEVEPAFSGKGVGRHMLNAAVEKARNEHFKILPLCPYAESVFAKDKSIGDVLF